MKVANNSKIVKKANRYLILVTIREFEPVTVEDIVQKTRLSRPTVLNIMGQLTEENIIEKVGYRESMGGRQPALYAMNLRSNFAVGIDFEFPPMHVVISDIKGNTRFYKKWEQQYDDSEEDVLANIVTAVREGMEKLEIDKEDIIGAGLGIPGIVNIRKNVPVSMPRMPEANGGRIGEILEESLGFPIYIRNDAHLLAMTESELLGAENPNMIYIAYRSGIGMAIFINGKLYEGNNGNSGYIGHTTFDRFGDRCSCGKSGCLETYCSKKTIVKNYNRESGQKAGTFREVLEKADEGNAAAAKVLEEAAKCFGIAIANVVKLLDIRLVVIGDLDCGQDHIFLKTIETTVNEEVSNYAIGQVKVIPGSVNECNYALGACMFVIDKFYKAPKLTLNI